MDFSYTEEQTLLRNSVAKYLADTYKYETWRKFTRGELGRDPAHWIQFAELGLLAAPLPEAHGGLGGGAIETSIIMEEFGKSLVVEPFVPTVVIGGGMIARAGSDDLKAEWIEKIANGKTILAFAVAESQGRYNLADLKTSAKKQGSAFVLNGHKAVVIAGPWADQLIVTARTAGGQREPQGVTVFLVDKKSKGIKDIVIYVSSKKVKVHPDYEKDAKGTVVMDNKHCRFEPHIAVLRVSQTLELHNSDPFSHNSNLAPLGDVPANPLIAQDGMVTYNFHKSQKLPVPVSCNIHGWMKGFIVVRDDPYAAVSDEHGNFELKNLPAEELEFTVWQEKSGWLAAGKGWSKKGVFKHKIKPGDNDLGVIKVSSKLFEKKK